MALATQISAALLFAFLVLVAPLRGRVHYERFRREVASDPAARLRYYRSSLTWKYALTLVAIALYFANDREGYGVRHVATGGSQYGEEVPLVAGVALGAVLGAVVLSSGLLLAMAVHALIDLRLLIIPPDLVAEAVETRDQET